MKLNKKLINQFKNSDSKLLAVTKYWDLDETKEFFDLFEQEDFEVLVGMGENRVKNLKEKNLDRQQTHFIGNIQTKEIKYIIKYCDTIHSIDNVKQIKKFNEICEKSNMWVKIFLQINIDKNKEGGIEIEEIPKFMELIDTCDNISLIGFSAIGRAEFTKEEKLEEFRLLKSLRDKYTQKGFVSAGTSRDYEIALEEGIDIIRVGKSLVL